MMDENTRLESLEKQFRDLQNQVVQLSELVGAQSNLIVKLSTQQTEASRALSLVHAALQEPADDPTA